jgi:hypothetical protein
MELKEGIITYEVELGCNMDNLAPPQFMNQGPVKKVVLRRCHQLYEEAGVVEKTSGEAFSNAFLVKKRGHISEGQEKMDDITFAKQWRLILDLSTVNTNISSYATEPSTVASVLEKYNLQELQCSVNILGAFHQVNLVTRETGSSQFCRSRPKLCACQITHGWGQHCQCSAIHLKWVFQDPGQGATPLVFDLRRHHFDIKISG